MPMSQITVYEKPTCSTCRQVDKILREAGEEYTKINYYVDPLSESKLRELLEKMNISARELLRSSEPIYKELGLAKSDHSDDELIRLMSKHPELIQRPIVERGSKAILGRPAEKIRELLK
jgi:arsenate reductase